MLSFKISAGRSSSIALPKEEMAQLGWKEGDTIYLTKEANGNIRLSRRCFDHERQMALAERIMHDDREILQALAK